MKRTLITGLAVASLAVAGAATSLAQTGTTPPATGSKAGLLTCHVDSGWGFIIGSSRDLKCTFASSSKTDEYYTGKVQKFGVDIGYMHSSVIVWTVLAAGQVAPGALAGGYGGVTGSAAVAGGVGASVLVGGSNKSITLQPLNIEGQTGLNVAAGIESFTLTPAKGPPKKSG
jgi:hypothetical protein